MLTLRKAGDRGHTDLGWLTSYHSFSFGGYNDPAHMGFRALRVINHDRIQGGKGFGAHGHRDMEIITYVLEGTLAHRDSISGDGTIGPNEIQTMSAGSGVIHSEFNGSATAPVQLLQIWIMPAVSDVEPSYQQISYDAAEKRGRLRLLAGPERREGSAFIHQDARMFAAVLGGGEAVTHDLAPGRHAWLQCASGAIDVNGVPLREGDGVAVSEERHLSLRGTRDTGSEILLFDLP
jgi:redox-sensitive bicupin YhaK (pirin superfamily)